MLHEKNEKEMWILQLGYHLARWIAVVSAVFCLIVCILLIANFFQLKSVDPLGSPVLERLIQRLAERPEDQEDGEPSLQEPRPRERPGGVSAVRELRQEGPG